LSEQTPTPESTPVAAATAAPESAAVATDAAAGADAEEFIADDKPDSEAKPEGKADDVKPEAKADDAEADDFLAETDDDEAKKDADAPGDAEKEGESKAYQPFTLPDGQALDEGAAAKATPIFQKLNLDQDGAQELVSLYADITKDALTEYHQSLAEGHAQRLKEWATETKAHPEFGGANLKASKAAAAQALALEPAARKVLVEYGLDRNPHVFALLARVGTKLSPDSLVREDAGTPVKGAPQRDADIFYS
jgi:hypothetical protein